MRSDISVRPADKLTRPDVKLGICKGGCSTRHRTLHVPANLCERCLLRTQEGLTMLVQMAAYMRSMNHEQRKALLGLCRGLTRMGIA